MMDPTCLSRYSQIFNCDEIAYLFRNNYFHFYPSLH